MSTPPTPANLTAKEQRKLERLRDLRRKLERGQHVQNRTLKTWMGNDAVQQIEKRWQDEKDSRPKPADKPPEIVEYEHRLKRANFVHAKAESKTARVRKTSGRLHNQAEHEYENALEYIQEQVGVDPTLQTWLDRPAIVEPGEAGTGIDFHSMPRVITSRSMENQSDGSFTGKWLTKVDIKIEEIDHAISQLENKLTDEQEADQAAKAKDMLKALKST